MTKIEWATHTENHQSGCTKASPACKHCYAELMSWRQENMARARGDVASRYIGVTDQDTRQWTGRFGFDREVLTAWFKALRGARTPRRVFAGSMTDLFHDDAPAEALVALAEEIAYADADATRQDGSLLGLRGRRAVYAKKWPHVIMLLTKRPWNLLKWQRRHFPSGLPSWVWVGTTAEDQEWANKRVPELLAVRVQEGGVRFLSMEPLLGPVDLCRISTFSDGHPARLDALAGIVVRPFGVLPSEHGAIGWVIAGGESGNGARASDVAWFRDLRDQCVRAGVPFFMKQMDAAGGGDKRAIPDDLLVREVPYA